MAASLSSKVLHRDFIRCCRLTYRQLRSIRTIASTCNKDFQVTEIKKYDEKIQFTSLDGENARTDSSVSSLPSYKQITEQQVHPLMAMPFNVISGGKFAIHLLKKFDSKRVLIFVRAAVLATELCTELKENGISCLDGTSLTKQEVKITEDKEFIIVGCYQDANRHSFPKADLIIMVQPPVDGIHSVIRFLLQQSFNTSSGKAVMLYNENDLSSLKEIQQYVEVVKLNPPSFFSVKQSIDVIPHNSSPGLPSVSQEEPLTEMERPLPAKVPQYTMFRPTVQVPRNRGSGRTRLNDYVRLYVRGGSGGQGSLTYAGLGGDGGNVVLQCQQGATFDHFSLKQNRRVIAGHGGHFTKEKRKKKGLRGLDVIVPVPPGTTVSTDDRQFLAEMNNVGSRLLVAHGGQGGNPSTEGWGGEKGKCHMIRLNLRLMADVGLVGFPNAGKSSLLGEISRASVKTGDFPFTTVRPSIGMMEFSDHFQVSVADLPGLVEGAHLNRGMGHKFLKHVERTTILLLVVDVNGFQLSNQHPKRNAFQSLCLLAKELYSYNNRLANRPKVLVVTKMDSDDSDKKYASFIEDLNVLRQQGLSNVLQDIEPDKKIQQAEKCSTNHLVTDSLEFEDIIPLSVITGTGMEQLRQRLRKLLID